jgi:predicted nucleic acid-binding protein
VSRIFCDVNVLLDHFPRRAPWHVETDAILAAAGAGQIVLCVSALTIANLHYVARRYVGETSARQAVRDCLRLCEILPVDRTALEQDDLLAAPDYEDNIQIACAIQAAAVAIVTRDPHGFANSPVPAVSPADLLARLAGPATP